MSWSRGEEATFVILQYDGDGAPVSVSSLALTLLDPDGTEVAGPLPGVLVAPGRYEVLWTVPANAALGGWTARWDASYDGEEASAVEPFTVTVAPDGPGPGPGPEAPGSPICLPWCSPDDLTCETSGVAEATIHAAIMAASETLWMLSGRQYGACEVEVFPCPPSAAPGRSAFGAGWAPVREGGAWLNVCGHASRCGCGPVAALTLPPVAGVDVMAVTIDGVALPHEAWEVQYVGPRRRLVRLDGERWPASNDLDAPPGSPGTWSLLLRYGDALPYLGMQAAPILACEYLKAVVGDSSCALPKRVQNYSRLGESFTLLDPQEFLVEGRTGVDLVDRFLVAVNPHGLTSAPTIWSPDVPAFGVRR